MTDPYENIVDFDDEQAGAANAVANIDAKPDRALRAIQLAQTSGVPATAIYPDLDEFERKQKAIAAGQMVQQNPHLASYMAKDPMNARLSIDDLHALDLSSEAVGKLGSKSIMGTFTERFAQGMYQAAEDTESGLERIGAAAVAGYDWAGQQHEFDRLLQEPWAQSFFGVNNPAHPGKLAFAGVFGFDSFMRLFNAGMVATAETVGMVGEAATGDPAKGRQLVRDIYQGLQIAATGPGAFGMTHPHVMSTAHVGPSIAIKPFVDPLRAAIPWLREGKEPPLGLHPEIDKLIIEQSKLDLDALVQAQSEARKSQTREMDPDRFAEFIREKNDASVFVDIDAIDRLYGEARPGVEDGKLGMVPGFAEQLDAARASGGRIEVPLADWLARVDPEVQKALHDDVAVRRGGVTKNEVKVYGEQALAIDEGTIEAYHGSSSVIDEFDPNKTRLQRGMFFADNPKTAGRFAKGTAFDNDPPRIYGDDSPKEIIDWVRKHVSEQEAVRFKQLIDEADALKEGPEWERLYTKINDELREYAHLDSELDYSPNTSKVKLRLGKNLSYDMGGRFDWDKERAALDQAKAEGYESVTFTNTGTEGNYHSVFNKDQIQSAWKPVPPRPQTPVESVRQAAALEPMFAIGDRKLDLKKTKLWPDEGYGAGHTFEILDDKGASVGYTLISESSDGKLIRMEDISGTHGYGPGDWGPALMRDIVRQLKEQFPNAEEMSFFRNTGARAKAGTTSTHGDRTLRLGIDSPEQMEQFRQILSDRWEPVSPDFEVLPKPREEMSRLDSEITKAIEDVLDRVVPKNRDAQVVESIRRTEGEKAGQTVVGLYQPYKSDWPLIAVALDSTDPIGYARHEAIHHLRQYGFFTDKEWAILEKAAREGKWVDEFGIGSKYKGQPFNVMFEESIAEAYRKWADGKDTPPQLHPIFEKMKQLYEAIRDKLKEILGKEPTWEDIFEKVEKGEVGQREGTKPRGKEVYRGSEARGPAQPELPGTRRMEDTPAFDRAPVGMSIERAQRYDKLIKERQKVDYEKELARAEKQQKKFQSAEWKAEGEAMRPDVTKEVLDRPDVSVDRFLRDGILYGEKVEKVRIGAEYLTPEQQAALPKSYVAKKGMNPDDIAGLFGYDSGATMIERMAQYDRQWRESGVRREEFVRRQIDQEIQRRLELKHGRTLAESILEDAKDQALSTTQLSILHEQTYHFATEAGMEYPLKKEDLQAMATKHFNELPGHMISSDRFLAESGRAGRAAEMAHLKGDVQEAFKQAQRQEYAAHYAKLAVRFEKEQKQFDKLAKRYSGRTIPENVERPYALHAAALLEEAGYPMRLRADEIQTELKAGEHSTLPELHEHSKDFGGGVYDMLTDDIMNDGVKPKEEMTVSEWRDFRDAVKAIHEEGRDNQTMNYLGEKIAFKEWLDKVRENLEKRELIDPQTRSKMMEYWWSIDAKLVTMENLLKDADFRQEMGPLFDAIVRTHEQSKSKAFQLEAELKESFDKLPGATFEWRQSLNKDLPNSLFVDPEAPMQPLKLRRENLLRIMLHQGTESNRYQLARGMMMAREGLKITEDRIEVGKRLIDEMIKAHATEQDAVFVKHIWDQHKKFKEERQQLQRNTSGNIVNWIEGRKVDFGFGEIEGEYYPLSPSKQYQLPGKAIVFESEMDRSKGPFQSTFRRATTPKNDLKERTGKAYYVDITSPIENVAIELKQVIRDIAYRDFGIQAGKVFYNPEFQRLFDRYYGPEYTKELIPWLKRALNIDNTQSKGGIYGSAEDAMRWARINVTHSALGWNIATIGSPSIGTYNYKAYGAYMANHAEAVKLTKDFSKVLNDMETLMDRDVHKQVGDYIKKTRYSAFQEAAVQAAFWAVKRFQMAMARVTFYEKFMEERPKQLKEALDKGLSPEDAMKVANDRSAILADARLRERHGSTGRGDMSAIMANNDEFVKTFGTLFMGYFSTIYNQRRTLAHYAREMYGADAPEARMKSRKEFMDGMVLAVGVPLLMTGVFYTRGKKDESWLHFLSRVVFSETLGMYPVAREFTFWADSGRFGASPIHSLADIAWNVGKDAYDYSQGKRTKKPFQHTLTALGAVGLVKGGMAVGRQLGGIHNVFRQTEPPPRDFGEWMRLIRWGETKKPR